MKVLAINGSPRKGWNTNEILKAALETAKKQGAETEIVHLYDINFTGCRSCFACKRLEGVSFGRCVLNDDLKPVLEQILKADVVLFGTPIYFANATANMRALFERLWFPSLNYDIERTVNYPRNVVCGLIYTMNLSDIDIYKNLFQQNEEWMNHFVGPTESFIVEDTLQFDDYSKYLCTMFDGIHKKQRFEEVFPQQKKMAEQWILKLMEKAKMK